MLYCDLDLLRIHQVAKRFPNKCGWRRQGLESMVQNGTFCEVLQYEHWGVRTNILKSSISSKLYILASFTYSQRLECLLAVCLGVTAFLILFSWTEPLESLLLIRIFLAEGCTYANTSMQICSCCLFSHKLFSVEHNSVSRQQKSFSPWCFILTLPDCNI